MSQQPPLEGHQPLLEPAVLVTENCDDCRGTGLEDRLDGGPCGKCEGSGRLVSEVPMSIAYRMMADHSERATAPPPSELRRQALEVGS